MIQPCDATKTWVEVRLIDGDGEPVPGAQYRIELPDGSIMSGNLDDDAKSAVRLDCSREL